MDESKKTSVSNQNSAFELEVQRLKRSQNTQTVTLLILSLNSFLDANADIRTWTIRIIALFVICGLSWIIWH